MTATFFGTNALQTALHPILHLTKTALRQARSDAQFGLQMGVSTAGRTLSHHALAALASHHLRRAGLLSENAKPPAAQPSRPLAVDDLRAMRSRAIWRAIQLVGRRGK
ncbi:MAG: hypothetical protein AAFR47_16210 [Pseudomonadota bacterium]